MVGKIDSPLFIAHGTDTLTITGTVEDLDQVGASTGDEVLVEVLELCQGSRKVSCNRKFPVVDPTVPLAWSMVVSASHFVSGAADSSDSKATLKPRHGGSEPSTKWKQPDPAITITKLPT
jgi:hypothetical protein